eukprot:1157668-Pelagomonas_calceolata.AAC.3
MQHWCMSSDAFLLLPYPSAAAATPTAAAAAPPAPPWACGYPAPLGAACSLMLILSTFLLLLLLRCLRLRLLISCSSRCCLPTHGCPTPMGQPLLLPLALICCAIAYEGWRDIRLSGEGRPAGSL